MACGPLPEGIITSPMTAAPSARRRAKEALMLVGKRPYIASGALRPKQEVDVGSQLGRVFRPVTVDLPGETGELAL